MIESIRLKAAAIAKNPDSLIFLAEDAGNKHAFFSEIFEFWKKYIDENGVDAANKFFLQTCKKCHESFKKSSLSPDNFCRTCTTSLTLSMNVKQFLEKQK